MPRLPSTLIRIGASQNPYLPLLLRECRDLESAKNELRWLREYVEETTERLLNRNARNHVEAFDQQQIQRLRRRRSPFASNAHGIVQSKKYILKGTANSRLNPRFDDNAVRSLWRLDSRSKPSFKSLQSQLLDRLVRRRSKGEPLQYIIGSQPFGDLEILCRKNVLIPRPETEFYTDKFASLLRKIVTNTIPDQSTFRILDLCSGTGCISLLLHSLLRNHELHRHGLGQQSGMNKNIALQIMGVDLSPWALSLSNTNLRYNVRKKFLQEQANEEVIFRSADVLSIGKQRDSRAGNDMYELTIESTKKQIRLEISRLVGKRNLSSSSSWDVVISNPPYISTEDYEPGGTTTRSVRRYEPKLALVPPIQPQTHSIEHRPIDNADIFYQRILEIADAVEAKAVVMEIGDAHQAVRVRQLAITMLGEHSDDLVEIWKDDGTVITELESLEEFTLKTSPGVDGNTSNDRAVVVWRNDWASWRRSANFRKTL